MAKAADYGWVKEANIYAFVQAFSWEEFNDSESRLLKESGPQYGAGGDIKFHLLEGAAGAMTLSDRLELFGSEVDYKGQLQNGTPYNTTVDYFGVQNRLDLGWAIPYRNMTVEPFTGVSYRWWQRHLQGAGGYTEEWYSMAALLGMRSQYQLGKEAQFFAMGAAKYPFSNKNSIDNYPGVGEIRLSPGSEWSALAEGGIRYKRLFASIYYENFIFPASRRVTRYDAFRSPTPGPSDFLQPRSESEIVGLRVGWAFK